MALEHIVAWILIIVAAYLFLISDYPWYYLVYGIIGLAVAPIIIFGLFLAFLCFMLAATAG